MLEKSKNKIIGITTKVVEDWKEGKEADKILYAKAIDNVVETKTDHFWYLGTILLTMLVVFFIHPTNFTAISLVGVFFGWMAYGLVLCIYVAFLGKITKKKVEREILTK